MKKYTTFITAIAITLVSANAICQAPDNVIKIDATPNTITTINANLGSGQIISDLRWASNSSVACFPATQNQKFTGNHVLHYFEIPPYSEVTITVIPKDKNANMSIYGYQVGTNNFSTPPSLSTCTACEADHKWDYPKRGKTQDHTRSIFFNSIKNSYNIFIGVAGADGLTSGDYELEIDLKSRIENTNKQESLMKYSAPSVKGKTVAYAGDLKDGSVIQDLSFAANSSVACFPATDNANFTGNQVFFITEIPSHSKMYITLIPDDKNANMSLYAYQDGTTKTIFPPELSSCVTCESDFKRDRPIRGKVQDHTRSVYLNAINNPYRVVIAVVGSNGLTTGGFQIQIKTE